jgi:hypothetical protein
VPFLDGHACGCEHVAQFLDAIVGERRDVIVRPDVNADDIAIGEVVVVADDGLEKPGVLAQPAGDVGDGADEVVDAITQPRCVAVLRAPSSMAAIRSAG